MDKKKTVIGKDVIESLTLGMYEDSKFIYPNVGAPVKTGGK